MMIDSKHLFQRLMNELTMAESQGEKEAVIMLVMEHVLGLSRSEVLTGKKVEGGHERFRDIIGRLNQHEPVQYILGEAEFYGRVFQVNPSVLVPRPETELLIDVVMNQLKSIEHRPHILDIGTGSGCIAVTLALEIKSGSMFATDISGDALAVARLNAKKMGAVVQFYHHDILKDDLTFGQFDAIASNPPYIPVAQKETLQKNVRDFEPALALFAPDSDPLVFYKAIARKSFPNLRAGGFLITEIHESFGKETKALFHSVGFEEVKILKDLSGKDRFVTGVRPGIKILKSPSP